MEKLQFDSGVRCFKVNGGACLRFNPADPNLLCRFLEAEQKISALENTLAADPGEPLALLARADRELKRLLGDIFGPGNDFDAIFQGVNLLAVAANGQRVITNFLEALEPVLLRGARSCAKAEAAKRSKE